MRVMVFGMANEASEAGEPPTMEAFEAMERFTEDLVAAGVLVAGAGLKPTSEGRRIVLEGDNRTVIDGPFADGGEVVAGFSIWEVADMDEAVAWARRSPAIMPGRSEMVIRPFIEAADMAAALDLEAPTAPGGERGRLGVA